jgi:hypothetical protein
MAAARRSREEIFRAAVWQVLCDRFNKLKAFITLPLLAATYSSERPQKNGIAYRFLELESMMPRSVDHNKRPLGCLTYPST